MGEQQQVSDLTITVMGELIARCIKDSADAVMTAEEIRKASVTGDATIFFGMYWYARAFYAMYTAEECPAEAESGAIAIVPEAGGKSRIAMFTNGAWMTLAVVPHWKELT